MKTRKNAILYSLLIILLLTGHCAKYPTRVFQKGNPVSLMVSLKKGTELLVPRATLTISAHDMETLEDSLVFDGSLFKGEFQVPVGIRRLFSVVVFDDDLVMFRGSRESDITGSGDVQILQLFLDSAIDTLRGRQQTEAANDKMGDLLYTLINETLDNADKPSDIDFTQVNQMYKTALETDGTNLDANFGAGLTEIMLVTSDPEVNATYDRWEAYLDTATVFTLPETPGLGKMSLSFPTAFSRTGMPAHTFARYTFGAIMAMAGETPLVSELQELINTEVVPRLDYAIKRLERVDEFPDYRFIITPEMMGDLEADAVEIDLTEIRLMLSMLYASRAFCRWNTAYNANTAGFDSSAIQTAFTQDSDYLTLFPDGAEKIRAAKADLNHSLDAFEAALDFFENEQDDQNDDAIKRTPDDITTADVDSAQKYIAKVRDIFNGPYRIKADWDDDDRTPDEEVEFDFGASFDNPITDVKALFPPYTVQIRRDTTFQSTENASFPTEISVSVTVDQPGNYFFDYSRDWNRDENGNSIPRLESNIDIPAWIHTLDSLYSLYRSQDDVGSVSINLTYQSYLDAGTHPIYGQIWTSIGRLEMDRIYWYPRFVWVANSFTQWVLPNPDFNGSLPGMTDARFKRLLGLSANDWKKTVDLKWTDIFD